MSEWRSRLTADEAYQLGLMERGLARHKKVVASIQKARKAIINRAVQRSTAARKKSISHPKLGVDTEHVTT